MKSIAEFDRLVKDYCDQSGQTVPDNALVGLVNAGVKNEKMADHLALNASKYGTCAALREELRVISVAQRRWGEPSSTSAGDVGGAVVPMDVDALTGKGKKGKKGKGKGSRT